MGVYLSTPNTQLEGTLDGKSSKLVFGASSMQGWRVGQEDAHIANAEYDQDTSLFGVFDGHGGPEVAKYCAQHLPQFLKSLNSYQSNRLSECLEEAFLKFDKSLTEGEVIHELKILSSHPEVDNDENDTDEDLNEAILLREEADLPIAEIMKRYNSEPTPKPDSESGSSRAGLSLPSHMRCEMKDRSKPVSPFLRAKRNVMTEPNHLKEEPKIEGQSSSSKMDVSSSSNDVTLDLMDKTKDSIPENSSQIESNEEKTSESKEVTIESSNGVNESKSSQVSNVSNGEIVSQSDANDSKSATPQIENNSSDDKTENSSESDQKTNVSNSSVNDKSVDETTATPYKGKGKYKKIITPEASTPDSEAKPEFPDKPIYEYFMEEFDEEEEESEDDSEDFEGNDESSDEELDDDSESEDDVEGVEGDKSAPCFERPGYDSGCTAVVALFKGNQLVVANAGDSRCVVSRDGKAVDMSVDHKPEDDIERERINKAGGKVTRDGRVNGGLNLSRAIGDHAYKQNKGISDKDQMITALPDIRTLEIDPMTDQFMVIACDGIWNSMTSQQVIDFVGDRIQKTDKLSTICDELFRTCLAPNTHGDGTGCDNMTAVIVKFLSIPTLKRKLDESENNSNDINTDSIDTNDKMVDVSEEPQTKRNKSIDEMEANNQNTVNEVDGTV